MPVLTRHRLALAVAIVGAAACAPGGLRSRSDASDQGSSQESMSPHPSALKLPEGWVFAMLADRIDTMDGAFHDRVSGLFVPSQLASSLAVIPWTSSVNDSRSVERERHHGRRWERVTLWNDSQGCNEQLLSVYRDDSSHLVWNFRARLCTQIERQRFATLVNGVTIVSTWTQDQPFASHELSTTDIDSLLPGADWSTVAPGLPPLLDMRGTTDGGFEVLCAHEGTSVVLTFDKSQRLGNVRHQDTPVNWWQSALIF